MSYHKPQLKRLERLDPEEYKLLSYLRNRRRRIIRGAIRFEVLVQDGKLRCREVKSARAD